MFQMQHFKIQQAIFMLKKSIYIMAIHDLGRPRKEKVVYLSKTIGNYNVLN